MVLVLAFAVAPLVGPTPLAFANPDDPVVTNSDCQFILTPPELVILPGGAKAVRATLEPKTCTPDALPTDIDVCVSTPDGPGDCFKTPGWSKSQVIVTASRYTGTFTAVGRGCWWERALFRQKCREAGPISVTF